MMHLFLKIPLPIFYYNFNGLFISYNYSINFFDKILEISKDNFVNLAKSGKEFGRASKIGHI